MARKIIIFILLFLSFIFINNTNCFCVENYPTLTLEQSEALFDFALNTAMTSTSSLKTYLNSSTPAGFMNYFNKNVAPVIYSETNGECDSSLHYIVTTGSKFTFFVTNSTLSNNLEFLYISPRPGATDYNIKNGYFMQVVPSGSNNYSYISYKSTTISTPLFYSYSSSDEKYHPTLTPSFSEDYTTLNTDSLYYLGPKALSDVNFTGPDGKSNWYFLKHCFGGVVPPSGDTPSGDTPSGDVPRWFFS